MSLIAHWPLNGTLKDVTGNGYNLVNTTGTVALQINDLGKLGKCYYNNSINNTSHLTSTKKFKFKDDCSMFCWVYVEGISQSNSANGVGGQHDHTTESGMGITLAGHDRIGSGTPGTFKISVNTGYREGGRTYHSFYSNTLLYTNRWYHIGFTYNNTTKQIKFYLNGKHDGTSTIASNLNMKYIEQSFSIFSWSIGNNGAANYRPTQKINDFRVYDEECSEKMIYEIYKTKMAHYTFNTCTEPTVNLIPNGSFGEERLQGNYTTATRGTIGFVLDRTAPNSMFALQHISSANDSYTEPMTARLGAAASGQTWTCSVWAKGLLGGEAMQIYMFGLNDAGSYVTAPSKLFTLTTQWERYVFTTTLSGTGITGIGSRLDNDLASQTIYYNGWQLEQKDHATPYIDGSRNVMCIKDDSDFNYNAVFSSSNSTAQPSWTSDSKLGNGCYSFNGTSNYIPLGNVCKPVTELTISAWAYKSTWADSKDERIISCTEGGGYNFEKFTDNTIGFALYANGAYRNPSRVACSTLSSGWHHFVGTFDGRYCKFYIDGVLKSTSDATIETFIGYNANNGIFIGAEAAGSATAPGGSYWKGKIDDVRIYATALKLEDITLLKDQRISIDNKGYLWSNDTAGRIKPSLLDYSFMKNGAWPLNNGWSLNGTELENDVIVKANPWGDEDYVFATLKNDVGSDGDGGFNSARIPVDYNKKYRFSIWIRRENAGNGRTYFGTYAYDEAGTNVGVLAKGTTTANTNPYFWSPLASESPEMNNEWVLYVAHMKPYSDTSTTNDISSGIYNIKGERVREIADFRMNNTCTRMNLRAYLYYSTNTYERQYFYRPRIDLCDGSEPTIEDLIKCREHDPIYNNPSITSFSDKGVAIGDCIRGRQIRYIRDYLAGSTANTACHWVEIEAYTANGSNIAKGKTVTSPSGGSNMERITNGSRTTGEYGGNFDATASQNPLYVQVDLGAIYDVEKIGVWHYYGDTRSYYKTKTQVSADGTNWYTVFDSAVEGTYKETSAGNLISLYGNEKVSMCNPLPSISGISNIEQKVFKGELWTKLFRHKNNNGTTLFSSLDEAKLCNQTNPNADKYSILQYASNYKDKYKGYYEFMLEFPEERPGMYNQWRQSNNPSATISGYYPVKIDWTANEWGGIAPSSSTTATYIDGSPGASTWYYAIGAIAGWSGKIPGPDFPVNVTNLWVKSERNKIACNRNMTL